MRSRPEAAEKAASRRRRVVEFDGNASAGRQFTASCRKPRRRTVKMASSGTPAPGGGRHARGAVVLVDDDFDGDRVRRDVERSLRTCRRCARSG